MALAKVQIKTLEALVSLGKAPRDAADVVINGEESFDATSFEKMLAERLNVPPYSSLVARGQAFEIPVINVARVKVSEATFKYLTIESCQQYRCLPVGEVGVLLLVAFADPFEQGLIEQVEADVAPKKVLRYIGRREDILGKLKKDDKRGGTSLDALGGVAGELGGEFDDDTAKTAGDEEVENEDSAPIVKLSSQIVEQAYYDGASDIHLDPHEHSMGVRFRIDGLLREVIRLPKKSGPALVARLKIMANLDISERRISQDGRIVFKQFNKRGIDVDLRMSTAPLNYGEGVVMRILDKQKSTLPLPALGFSAENLARYRECIRQPYGMILHCGPTGSGKSMTLYSALNEVNTPDICVRTAEDPIEYTLPGLNQMQMNRQIGVTFASALRAFLRQDPDIILVGEIRDKETANIAIEAALTGHLLISTLHTNDAPSTVARLTDMGIEAFMISSSLVCVCAQRLLRRVCKKCKEPYEPEGREKELLHAALGWSGTIYRSNPKGCVTCGGSGYKGRCGIHELMTNSKELSEAINKEAETSVIKQICIKNGMKTLHQDSMLKVKEGITTMIEALANIPPDME